MAGRIGAGKTEDLALTEEVAGFHVAGSGSGFDESDGDVDGDDFGLVLVEEGLRGRRRDARRWHRRQPG